MVMVLGVLHQLNKQVPQNAWHQVMAPQMLAVVVVVDFFFPVIDILGYFTHSYCMLKMQIGTIVNTEMEVIHYCLCP